MMISIWPGLLLFCTLAARSGVRFRLLGIEVVRSDGLPAGRFRCAWRVLICWVPPMALYLAGRVVEDNYWHTWTPESPTWPLLVLPVCWSLAVVLLALFLGTALIWTQGGLHDRLAGTRLVQR